MSRKIHISRVLLHVLAGTLMGFFFLHPVTMLLYAYESGTFIIGEAGPVPSVARQLLSSFHPAMLPMGLFFIVLGATMGLGAGLFSRAIARKDRVVKQQERQLQESVGALIKQGEDRALEFKSSLRWDHNEGRVNRVLEEKVVNTLAGFMNGLGGTLLIGVDDAGRVRGIELDYSTLRKKDRDGFQQKLQELVATRIGADACAMVHVLFHHLEERDVCRVYAEPAAHPVYVRDQGASRFFLRTGNATRQLDVQEAMQHITTRWEKSRA